MDFFESQELARRNTRRLIVMLIVTMLAIIGSVYVVVLLAFGLLNSNDPESLSLQDPMTYWLALFWTVVGVVVIVGFGTISKMLELRRGGQAVAHMLQGRRLQPNSGELAERRLLNVVEEMALAAGMPVPPVYVLDHESGINAFAAGHTVDDAVIGVNRGTLNILNRDELQGVIGHEFSHILNGDMRMSLKLIGLLHGVQAIALIGYFLIRIIGTGAQRRSSSKDSKGDPTIFLLILGGGLLVVGSVGLFCARLIKASISRQREFLADASSIQFTRNPEGIGGALKMIAVESSHSKVKAAHAEEISHMFFANMTGDMFASFLSTHPPLNKRIQAIEPRFNGNLDEYLKSRATATIGSGAEDEKRTRPGPAGKSNPFFDLTRMGGGMGMPEMGMPGTGMSGLPIGAIVLGETMVPPEQLIAGIGTPTDDDVTYSQFLLGNIPRMLLDAVHDLYSARCVVYGTLLDHDRSIRENQIALIQQREGSGVVEELQRLWPAIERMDTRYRMPVFEILQGTLVGMSAPQYRDFRKMVTELIAADQKISLFEFFLRHHLVVHLDRHFGHGLPHPVKYTRLPEVDGAIAMTLSVLAKVGHVDEQEARQAFQAGVKTFPSQVQAPYVEGGFDFKLLASAITELSHASPKIKKLILTAAATTISYDHHVNVDEAEMFRAFSESLDCPVPPLLATPNPNRS